MGRKHSGVRSNARLSMKVGDLVRWQSWDKRVRVGLIVRLFRPGQNRDLWAYTQEGDAIKADDPHVEVISESR